MFASRARASRVGRDRARRFRFDAETGALRESAHGQFVADWAIEERWPGAQRHRCEWQLQRAWSAR